MNNYKDNPNITVQGNWKRFAIMSDIKRLDVTVMIREFLRDRQLTKTRTVSKDILNLLIENEYILYRIEFFK
ncbi:hypothetical protein A3Q56_07386 [Intoshia linei]|uniref:Uncharacterized protein n=1 Tax=Intoshia linei TaxID=1819745 RepID=A0A177ATR8_9BILA|nr:hypothetical protein A3Q56_07386 [Intoshia linei]